MPKQKSLKSQSAWILFAKITGFAISFLLPLLIVRFLTQDKVGVYRQAFQVIVNAVAVLPLGFSMSAYYFLNRDEEYRKATILNILLFNFVTDYRDVEIFVDIGITYEPWSTSNES